MILAFLLAFLALLYFISQLYEKFQPSIKTRSGNSVMSEQVKHWSDTLKWFIGSKFTSYGFGPCGLGGLEFSQRLPLCVS